MINEYSEKGKQDEFISLCIMYTKQKSLANRYNIVQTTYVNQNGEN